MIVLLAAIVAVVAADDYVFPNGTETKLHFFSCNPSDTITVSTIELFDRNGISMYPVRLQDLATIKLTAHNSGNVVLKDKVNVHVDAYQKKDGQYQWVSVIPEIFQFLLNNIDGCKMANNCPLEKGDLKLTLQIDLYKYAILFSFIDKSDMKPYNRLDGATGRDPHIFEIGNDSDCSRVCNQDVRCERGQRNFLRNGPIQTWLKTNFQGNHCLPAAPNCISD